VHLVGVRLAPAVDLEITEALDSFFGFNGSVTSTSVTPPTPRLSWPGQISFW
jgi:hypothetical protein